MLDLLSFIRQALPPSSRTPVKIALTRMLFAPILVTVQALDAFRSALQLQASSSGQVIVLEALLNAAIGRSYLIYILDGNFRDVDFQVVIPSDLPADMKTRIRAVLERQHLQSKRWSLRSTDEVSWGTPEGHVDPPSVKQMVGHLDSLNSVEVRGWAADKSRLNFSLDLDVYIDGLKVSTVSANALREDVGLFLGDQGYHAFRYSIPAGSQTVGTHLVDVRFSETGESIPNSPQSFTISPNTPDPPVVPALDFRIFVHWDGISGGFNLLALALDAAIYSGRLVPLEGQTGNWPTVDLKIESFVVQTINGAVTVNRRYLFFNTEKVPGGKYRVEVWRKLFPSVIRIKEITLSGTKFEDEITPSGSSTPTTQTLEFTSGYPKLDSSGTSLLWAVSIAGAYVTRIKKDGVTVYQATITYAVGGALTLGTDPGHIYRVEIDAFSKTLAGEIVTTVEEIPTGETAFSIPRVNGLDSNFATVTRSVVGGEIRYTITPNNVPSGYTAYLIVNNQISTSFSSVTISPQRWVDVNIIYAKAGPSDWWKYKEFDGVTNPSAEYTLRNTMVNPGHQFSFETGLPTN